MKRKEEKGEKMEEVKDKIIKEYAVSLGESPSGGVFRVLRGFYMKVVNGPNVEIKPRQLCELGKESATALFCIGKVEPMHIPSEFKVMKNFRMTVDGLYVSLRPGDIVELDREEALWYWRKGFLAPAEKENT